MQISDNGFALIKKYEGCRLRAYPDPGTGGAPWTIGFGWTQPVEGKPVTRGMEITQETADRLLRRGVVQFEQVVNRLVKVRLSQNQFDALVSLCYNIGPRSFSSSTLLRLLNRGDYAGAAARFLDWRYSGRKVLPGLVTRRGEEKKLFLAAP